MHARLWERRGAPPPPPAPSAAYAIYPVSSAEIMELVACDRALTGLARGPMLAERMSAHPHQAFVAVRRADGVFSGHVLRSGDRLGPLVAADDDAAAWLLHAALAAGVPARAFVPPAGEALFRAAGFAPAGEPRDVAEARAATEYALAL